MGKKGSWFSAIKRVFTPHSKEKLGKEPERKSVKEKRKKGFGKLRNGETNSFLPIFRGPSSIEKILGEAEREHNLVFKPPISPDRSNASSASAPPPPPPPLRPASPRVPSPRPTSPRAVSPRPSSPRSDLPRLDSPRAPSPKPPDQSRVASASAPPPPLRPASPRVPSQRFSPPIVSSPRPTSPQVASQEAISSIPPSPKPDPPKLDTPKPSTPKPPSPRPVSPKVVQQREIVYRPEPTLLVKHASATKIQAAFRGYMARRSFRALKGLVRLQGVVRGYSVKRQTTNAMKYMQLLVRVQSQIQSRRIKMLENQTRDEKDATWAASLASEAGYNDWDDSVLTKEEREARMQRKIDAVIKRERSMAYAYSNKLWKNNPKSAQDIRSSGLPLWWNWVDRQLPLGSPAPSHSQPHREFKLTPTRLSPSPLRQSSNQHNFRLDSNFETSTPKSSTSTLLTPSRHIRTPPPLPQSSFSVTSRYSRGRRGQDSPFKDDDSLTSCPPFPSYMAPTVSAKAKVRPNSNPKERVMGTPVSNEQRRMSFPFGQGQDTFRWNKGSLLMSNSSNHKGPGSPGSVVLEKRKTLRSVGNTSIDSTVSMPATIGRKPFNRFV